MCPPKTRVTSLPCYLTGCCWIAKLYSCLSQFCGLDQNQNPHTTCTSTELYTENLRYPCATYILTSLKVVYLLILGFIDRKAGLILKKLDFLQNSPGYIVKHFRENGYSNSQIWQNASEDLTSVWIIRWQFVTDLNFVSQAQISFLILDKISEHEKGLFCLLPDKCIQLIRHVWFSRYCLMSQF